MMKFIHFTSDSSLYLEVFYFCGKRCTKHNNQQLIMSDHLDTVASNMLMRILHTNENSTMYAALSSALWKHIYSVCKGPHSTQHLEQYNAAYMHLILSQKLPKNQSDSWCCLGDLARYSRQADRFQSALSFYQKALFMQPKNGNLF